MKDPILSRLKRIQGQTEGVVKMYEEQRNCEEVVTQIAAVRAAFAAVGKEILTGEAVACSRPKERGKLNKLLTRLFEIS